MFAPPPRITAISKEEQILIDQIKDCERQIETLKNRIVVLQNERKVYFGS
jgi:hypothetical protein